MLNSKILRWGISFGLIVVVLVFMVLDFKSLFTKTMEPSLQALPIPPLLSPSSSSLNEVVFTLNAQESRHAYLEGDDVASYGYNGSYLGPTIVVQKGQLVHIQFTNELKEATTLHWHGLILDSTVDGGPHSPIKSNTSIQIDLPIDQEAATLWYHPHLMSNTARQVYLGLAGFLYVEDENSEQLNLPNTYGVDDIPLVIQDRVVVNGHVISYEEAYQSDGTIGNEIMVNGVLHPFLDVDSSLIRLRLLNGSNALSMTYRLDSQASFYQIASDGGFLNQTVELKTLTLSPAERAEILIDLSGLSKGQTVKLLANDQSILDIIVQKDQMNAQSILTTLNDLEPAIDPLRTDRTFSLEGMMSMVSINGKVFDMDVINEQGILHQEEVWEITNVSGMMGAMTHPFHVHGVQFRVLTRNGIAVSESEAGYKDTVAIAPNERVRILITFNQLGLFMYHCHILEHEENGMMGQISISEE